MQHAVCGMQHAVCKSNAKEKGMYFLLSNCDGVAKFLVTSMTFAFTIAPIGMGTDLSAPFTFTFAFAFAFAPIGAPHCFALFPLVIAFAFAYCIKVSLFLLEEGLRLYPVCFTDRKLGLIPLLSP